MKKRNFSTRKLTETLTSAALIGGGVVAERVASKVLNKVIAKSKPELLNTAAYKYGASAAMIALGLGAVLFARGKQAGKLQQVGLGISASGVHRLANEAAGGRLSGIYAPVTTSYTTPSLTNYVSLPPIPPEVPEDEDIDYEVSENTYTIF